MSDWRALVVHPKLLLMDEPFSALDVLTAETLRTDLLDLWDEGRMPISSILLVTHNIEEAVLMSDRILVFSSNPGRLVAEIPVTLPQPRNRLDPTFRQLVDDIYALMTARPAGKAPGRLRRQRHLNAVAAPLAQPAGRLPRSRGGRPLPRPRRSAGAGGDPADGNRRSVSNRRDAAAPALRRAGRGRYQA